MKVYCYPVSRTSKYIPLLFAGIEARYVPVYRQDGTLVAAAADLAAGTQVVVHVHWEEFLLRDAGSDDGADRAAADFEREILAIKERKGKVFWTIHNELPHMIGFERQFLAVRRFLARQADAILVHNAESIEALSRQVPLDRSRVRLLPHPSYLDRYEDEATLIAGLADPPERRIQGFGWIRLQKGFGEMVGMLPREFLAARGAGIRVSGHGVEAAAVIGQQAARTDVHWDIRHVPDGEVPQLLRSAACVVLPYERLLTSGVALLAMSVGALLVSVDAPQLRELLPHASHRFLYPRRDVAAFQAVIDDVLQLPVGARRDLVDANLEAARRVSPARIAARLAALYDEAVDAQTPAMRTMRTMRTMP